MCPRKDDLSDEIGLASDNVASDEQAADLTPLQQLIEKAEADLAIGKWQSACLRLNTMRLLYSKELIKNKQRVSVLAQGCFYHLIVNEQNISESQDITNIVSYCHDNLEPKQQAVFYLEILRRLLSKTEFWQKKLGAWNNKDVDQLRSIILGIITEFNYYLRIYITWHMRLNFILGRGNDSEVLEHFKANIMKIFHNDKIYKTVDHCINNSDFIGLISLLEHLYKLVEMESIIEKTNLLRDEFSKIIEKFKKNDNEANALKIQIEMKLPDAQQFKNVTSLLERSNLEKIDIFFKAVIPLIIELDKNASQDHFTYWEQAYSVFIDLSYQAYANNNVAVDVVRTTRKSQPRERQFNFEAGIKRVPADGDCGYTSFAWGIVVLVLLNKLSEVSRKNLYNYLQLKLSLSEPDQESFKDWILTKPMSDVLSELTVILRKLTVLNLKSNYENDRESYIDEAMRVHQLLIEQCELHQIFKDATSDEERKKSKVGLNAVADQLSCYQLHHYKEFKLFLSEPGKTKEAIETWWEESKEIYFTTVAKSQQEQPDTDSSGDTRIYATHKQLHTLAKSCGVIVEFDGVHCAGLEIKDIKVNQGLLGEYEQAILMSIELIRTEQDGIYLCSFRNETSLFQALANVEEPLRGIIQGYYQNIPKIRLINQTGIHWDYELVDQDAADLKEKGYELDILLGGDNIPTAKKMRRAETMHRPVPSQVLATPSNFLKPPAAAGGSASLAPVGIDSLDDIDSTQVDDFNFRVGLGN